MDLEKLFKGQKIDINCLECETEINLDAGDIFKKNNSVQCPGCNVTINFETDNAIKDLKKKLEQLTKSFK